MPDPTDRQRAEAKAPSTEETCWLDLVEKDDRTSPTEYPDHALITRNELFGYMQIARREGRIAGREEAAAECKLVGDDWRDAGVEMKAFAAEYLETRIRALKPKES